MANPIKPTIETGAMTLVLLVKNYKSQMIALLLKNGVTVPMGASNQQIAMLMANLLKVSKSFFTDLNAFIQNPKVIEVLAGGITENAQYFRASGSNFAGKRVGNAQYFRASGFMNSNGGEDGFTDTGEPAPTGTTTPNKGFWSDLNFGNLFSQALGAFGQFNTNQTNVAIANAHAQAGSGVGSDVGSGVSTGGSTGGGTGGGKNPNDGLSTTTIVVLSLVGVAVVGTIIYFIARPKN
jgi:hypothetical protein